eukprot:g779.t1
MDQQILIETKDIEDAIAKEMSSKEEEEIVIEEKVDASVELFQAPVPEKVTLPKIKSLETEDEFKRICSECGIRTELFEEMVGFQGQLLTDHPLCVGKAISKIQIEETGIKGEAQTAYAYSECNFTAFSSILLRAKTIACGKGAPFPSFDSGDPVSFVDFGCGMGKLLFFAPLLHSFQTCIGFEILLGLKKSSDEIKQTWDQLLFETKDDSGNQGSVDKESFQLLKRHRFPAMKRTKFLIKHANFMDTKVKDTVREDGYMKNAALAIANSTCFTPEMFHTLASSYASQMRDGSFFITFTHRLPSEEWELLERRYYTMEWGEATVYFHRKGK